MLRAKVMQLFELFADVDHGERWNDLVDAAIFSVVQQLRDGADKDDVRLSYYAAACANVLYRTMVAAKGRLLPTYAGSNDDRAGEKHMCELAERLMLAYRKTAADLLRDDAFVFRAVGN